MTVPSDFWAGPDGDAYTQRNQVDWQKRIPFWDRLMKDHPRIEHILEVGCNAGWNLRAIREINERRKANGHDSLISLQGVDINQEAVEQALDAGIPARVGYAQMLEQEFKAPFDLVFTAGVLIHLPAIDLVPTMQKIIDASADLVLAIEYASDRTEEIEYRGKQGLLWKRPFGMLYEALGLTIIDQGEAEGFDRCHFWLMEKA